MTEEEKSLLPKISESYRISCQANQNRGTRRLKIIHGWLKKELEKKTGTSEIRYQGLSEDTKSKEVRVEGKYYGKKVDLLVYGGEDIIGIVSVKFITRNYSQNSNNYFEQQLGEVLNLRKKEFVYGNLIFLCYPTPYYSKGIITGFEKLSGPQISKYIRLYLEDAKAYERPEAIGFVLIKVDPKEQMVSGIVDPYSLDVEHATQKFLHNKVDLSSFITNMVVAIKTIYEKRRS